MPAFPAFKTKPYYSELSNFLAASIDLATGELLDSAVRPVVVSELADNQTVVDAAAAAVDAEPRVAANTAAIAAGPVNARASTAIIGDGVADDTAALQADLTAAAGRTWYLRSGDYRLTAALVVPANTTVILDPDAVIVQDTIWTPVFDVYHVDDVTIQGGHLRYEGTRTSNTPSGTNRGGGPHEQWCGVWIGDANRITVRDMRFYGFEFGVTTRGWDGSAVQSYLNNDITIENITIDTVDTAVLAGGFDGLTLRGIRGTYTIMATGTMEPPPSHLIYLTGSTSELGRGLVMDDCHAHGGTNSFAYQIKYVRGGTISNVHAQGCPGTLNILDCHDIEVRNVVSLDDAPASGYSVDVQQTSAGLTARISIEGVSLTVATATHLVSLGGEDVTLSGLSATVAYPTHSSSVGIRVSSGTRQRIIRPRILNTGAGSFTGVQVQSGATVTIKDPVFTNANYGVRFLEGSGGVCRFDPAAITTASGAPQGWRIGNGSTTARFDIPTTVSTVTKASAGLETRPACDEASHYIVSITATGTQYIKTPNRPWIGATLTLEIVNNSGGAVTVNFDAAYVFRAAWANPATGARTVVTFRYDGTNWQEIGRAG